MEGKVSGNHSDGQDALTVVTGSILGTPPLDLLSPTLETPVYRVLYAWDRTGRAPVRAANSGSSFCYKMGRT